MPDRRNSALCFALLLLSGLFAGSASIGMAVTPAAAIDQTAPGDPHGAHIAEAAHRFGIPADWIRAVMRIESAGDVRAVSAKGARGLMQLMPTTWAELRAQLQLGADPFNPRDNILAGAAYLRDLHDRYGSPGFLAAYNAGPGALRRASRPGVHCLLRPAPMSRCCALLSKAVRSAKSCRPPAHCRAAGRTRPCLSEPLRRRPGRVRR
jgi:soluble lytic murein transglycosylase-like protein